MICKVRIDILEELRIGDWDALVLLQAKVYLNAVFVLELGFVVLLSVLAKEYIHFF